jgi:hypothetical protein
MVSFTLWLLYPREGAQGAVQGNEKRKIFLASARIQALIGWLPSHYTKLSYSSSKYGV